MATRVINATVTSGGNIDKKGGQFVTFGTVTDPGTVNNGVISSATLYLSSFRSYNSNYYLNVIFGGNSGDVVASTGVMIADSSIHADTIALENLSPLLLTRAVSTVTIGIVAIDATSYNRINLRDGSTLTLTVNYDVVTPCTPPSTVAADQATAAPGSRVLLSWSGAASGSSNALTGYQIYRSTEADGTYELLTTVSTTATSGSAYVVAPTTNGSSYYYKIRPVGTRSGYTSDLSTNYATLTCSFESVAEPTAVRLSATNAAPGASVTLSWSGAEAGENNAITGYKVYRSTTPDGTYELLSTVSTTATSGSTTVTAPTTNGSSYYYRVQTLGTLSGSDSGLTSVYATLTCTYSAPGAPGNVRLNGSTLVYAEPSESMTLTWNAAADGANNPITGYTVMRDGESYQTGLPASSRSCTVPSNATVGSAYSYSVIAVGTYSNSTHSTACQACTYSNPTAPTSVTVSNSNPPAGTRVTLSWSGAQAGGYNPISGYKIYRSTAVNGTYTHIANVVGTASSFMVDAPTQTGGVYYFRIATVCPVSESSQSSAYASATAGDEPGGGSDTRVLILPDTYEKRRIIFGDYDTAEDGGWTLTGWSLSTPETQSRYIDIPFRRDGPLDQTTLMTDGDPRYGSRSLEATFECSEGTRMDREVIISDFINRLHGQRMRIVLPDDPGRYIVGRLHVEKQYNDPAHASVKVTGICEPWRYSQEEITRRMMASSTSKVAVLSNTGRKVIVPEITISGFEASVTILYDLQTWTLEEGTYRLPRLKMPKGNTLITYSGIGDIEIRYREAIL